MVQPPDHGDMKVDTTGSEVAESRLRRSDDVVPSQMMFGLAMEEVQCLAVHFIFAATSLRGSYSHIPNSRTYTFIYFPKNRRPIRSY